MKIEWNKVTWYSKAAAIVLFVGTFYLGYYIGDLVHSAYDMPMQITDVDLPDMAVINAALFTCAGGEAVYAAFRRQSVSLTLSDGRNITLPQAVSASGTRYATENDSFVFWQKENAAFIEENGKEIYSACVTI